MWKKVLEFLKKAFIIMFVAQLVYVILLRWVDPPITVIQLSSWIQGDGLTRDYVPMEDISPNARLAVMAGEDQLFPDHNGFDWKSIEKAMQNNQKKKTRIKGASTISQQVAKNVFLWQGQSIYTKWFRKGLEAYFTFMIENVWGKRRILEVYLNVSETGKGIFGIEAASRKFFRKSARQLTASEAAMIAASLPNPKKFTVKPISKKVSSRYPWIVQQMNNLKGDPEIEALLK